MESYLSSPAPDRLALLAPVLRERDGALRRPRLGAPDAVGIPQRWYDVLVHPEESPNGIQMTELADRILYSKSGFTRVIDRMEAAGLVRRVRPEHDRRSILVLPTEKGTKTMERARRTTETASNDTSPSTSATPTSRPSHTPSKRSAPTHARCDPAVYTGNTRLARDPRPGDRRRPVARSTGRRVAAFPRTPAAVGEDPMRA